MTGQDTTHWEPKLSGPSLTADLYFDAGDGYIAVVVVVAAVAEAVVAVGADAGADGVVAAGGDVNGVHCGFGGGGDVCRPCYLISK